MTDGQFSIAAEDGWLQYRATFVSPSGDGFPVLERVDLTVE
ncbi:MAG: hypothetical protein WDM96_11815 [Lacunisphaera sp.]